MDHITSGGVSRRNALRLGVGAASLTALGATLGTTQAADAAPRRRGPSVHALEQQYGVRIGLCAKNLGTGQVLAHRQHTRFPVLSTFKTLAVAAVLRDLDHGGQVLRRHISYDASEVVENSPITSQRHRMTVGELCDAALRYSDNTAGNLLLRQIGGPRGLTRFARSIGDRWTRLDRWEPELNEALPGDPRDTSTPAALAATYQHLLVGPGLAVPDRWLLRAWMQGNRTGDTRLRAGIPATWSVAEKTGGGAYGTVNDVGLAVAPDGTELLIAAMTRSDDPDHVADNAVLEDLASTVVDRLTGAVDPA